MKTTTSFINGLFSLFAVAGSAVAVIPDTWVLRNSPATNQLNGATYGNGSFVVVGNETTILLLAIRLQELVSRGQEAWAVQASLELQATASLPARREAVRPAVSAAEG
jgi:hypothetical protein